jgi:hypothetical protein
MVEGFGAWLLLRSAAIVFGSTGLALALLIGAGLGTRIAAMLGVTMVGYHMVMCEPMSYPSYWTVLLLFVVARGPG